MRTSILSLVFLLTATAVAAEDAKSVFDSLFAAKIKAASASVDRADDVALAKEMLALAKSSENQPALVALLCEAAHDLGAKHADGFAVAAEAMTLLADRVEEKIPAAREKLIALLTKQSAIGKADEREPAGEALIELLVTIGDEKTEKKQYAEAIADYRRAVAVATQKKSPSLEDAKAKMDFATSRERTMKNLARLQEKLLKDADSATAEEIVKVYVVELDEPEAAKAYLNRVKDEPMKRFVPLASQPVDQVGLADARGLGEWYRSLVTDVKLGANRAAMERSRGYLSRFLELHETKDLARTKAEVMLKEVEAALLNLPRGATSTAGAGRMVDVLRLMDAKKDGMVGVTASGRGLMITSTPKDMAVAAVPVAMNGAYEMHVTFVRVDGFDLGVCVPVAGRHMLHVVDGFDDTMTAIGQVTAPLEKRVVKGKRHNLVITVNPDDNGQVRIASQLDGRKLVEWSGPVNKVQMDPREYPGHASNPTLRVLHGSYSIQELKIKPLSGTVAPTDHLFATQRVGGWGGGRFHQVGPKGSMVVGFRGTAGRMLQSIQPIYRVGAEQVNGTLIRPHADTAFEHIAKEGYAVGAINYSSGNFFDGFEIVFMKIKGDKLDPKDSYKSPWIGGRGGNNGTFSSEGAPVVGIHGGTGADFDGLGVIFRR